MNKKALIALVVLVIVIAGAAFWLMRKDPNATESTNTTKPTSSESTPTDTTTTPGEASQKTITYSDSGYSPSTITVKTGDTIVIKNTSSHSMMFDSDPHPVHTINPELNVDTVAPGESRTFVVDTKGTFGYHNHLNASQKGTIIVE